MSQEDSRNHRTTQVNVQKLGGQTYLDAAGFPGRTVGLEPLEKCR
jgi:hypothetical protein